MQNRPSSKILFLACTSLLVLFFYISLAFGVSAFWSPLKVLNIVLHPSPTSLDWQLFNTVRLPRALAAAGAGILLGVSGTLVQGMSRNFIASPAVLGVNAGAALAIALALTLFQDMQKWQLFPIALLGASIAISIVFFLAYALGSFSGVYLILSGIAVSAFLNSFTQALVIFFENSSDSLLYWLVGGVDGVIMEDVRLVLLFGFFLVLLTPFFGKALNAIALGDATATSLGYQTTQTRLLASALAIALAALAVSIAGPISFIGFITPNILRALGIIDYRLLLVASALVGGCILLLADILSRLVFYPFEAPAGVLTSLIGALYFLWFVRRGNSLARA